jgi:hypothetical protein
LEEEFINFHLDPQVFDLAGQDEVWLPNDELGTEVNPERIVQPANMVSSLLSRLLMRVMLLSSERIVARIPPDTAWPELRALYTSTQLSTFEKCERLIRILNRCSIPLPREWREVTNKIQQGFELIRVIQGLSLDNDATLLAQGQQAITHVQNLLAQPLVIKILPPSESQMIREALGSITLTWGLADGR